MDVFSQLKIGDRLNIERCRGDNIINEKNILNAQLIDLREKDIYISTPIYKRKRYFLNNGQIISVFFYRDTAVYQFYAEVLRQVCTNITAFIIRPTSGLYRIQRREHYRLPIVINAILEKRQNDKIHKLRCVTKDLSGGGIKAICKERLEEGENIKIKLYLYINDRIILNGKVVRVIKDTITNCYELGIRFDRISQANEDKIYAFVFKKQCLFRKKGLI